MDSRTVAVAQIFPVAGDLDANSKKIVNSVKYAAESGARVVVFGEMSLTGPNLKTLLNFSEFLSDVEHTVTGCAKLLQEEGLGEVPVIIGYTTQHHAEENITEQQSNNRTETHLGPIAHSSAAVLYQGKVHSIIHKNQPSKDLSLNELGYVKPAIDHTVLELGSTRAQIIFGNEFDNLDDIKTRQESFDTNLFIILDHLPYRIGNKRAILDKLDTLSNFKAPILYANLCGSQDGLVFNGLSQIRSSSGEVLARAPQFEEQVILADLNQPSKTVAENFEPEQKLLDRDTTNEEIWAALVSGLKYHCQTTGLSRVILGLSGGIDSALCAALAVDALGAERVLAVSMPSRISSAHSVTDAEDLAKRCGLDYRSIPIGDIVDTFVDALPLDGVAYENLQARIRGMILMSLSNQEGGLVLNTSNKSELVVGYSTIYGDSVGGYSPLKDVLKTQVWELSRWRNRYAEQRGETPPIPENTITKPPSAELAPGQTDDQSLPDYDILDPLITGLLEHKKTKQALISEGFDPDTIDRIMHLYRISEWKRQQSAIGTQLTNSYLGPVSWSPIAKKLSRLN